MNRWCMALASSLCAVVTSSVVQAAAQAEPQTSSDAAALRAVEARIRAASELGPQQAALAKYLGRWDVDIALPGASAHSKGTAEYSWVIGGRWLGCRIKGTMLGQPFEEFTILGYDSYAKEAVEVSVESADNAMLMARGSTAGSARAASVLFGELDEYLSGSLHRPYKVVLRWLDARRHVTEVWDVGAGETPIEKVVFTFSR
jgi:hypothetical protein